MDRLADQLKVLDPERREYLLETLAARLRDAGQWPRLRQLFASDAWMRARFAWSGRTYDGFIRDLSDAWQAGFHASAADSESLGIGDCLRLALIRTSLNSLAENYPPELVVRAVELGLWDPSRAVGIAVNVPDPQLRVECYRALLATRRYDAESRVSLARAGMEIAINLKNDHYCCEGIEKLAPYLDAQLFTRALERAGRFKEAELRVRAAGAIARASDGPLRDSACQMAFGAVDQTKGRLQKAEALVSLMGIWDAARDEELANAALKAVRPSGSPRLNVEITLAAARKLPPPRQRELAWAAYQTALKKYSSKDLGYLWKDLLPLLDPSRVGEVTEYALNEAMKLDVADPEYDFPRPVALMSLAPYLSGADLKRGLAEVQKIPTYEHFQSIRAMALNAFALRLSELGRTEAEHARQDELATVQKIAFEPSRASSFTELARLDTGERARYAEAALESALRLPDTGQEGSARRNAVGELAPLLDASQVLKALEGLCDIADYEERALVLLSLARRGASEQRAKLQGAALEALWTVRHYQMAKFTLEKLVPSLRDEAAARALELSKELPTKGPFSSDRGVMIAGLARHLPPAYLGPALEEAIALPEEMDRAGAVTSLIHRLDRQARERAIRVTFEAIEKMKAASIHHANALRDLAPWLDSAGAARAWRFLLREEQSLDQISHAFPALTERFERRTAKDALPVVLRVTDRFDRVASLVNLAKKLEEPDRSQALRSAVEGVFSKEIWSDLDVENCAIVLAPFLKGKDHDRVLQRGFEKATSIGNHEMRADALLKMLPLLEGNDRRAAMETGFRACFRIEKRAKAARLVDSFLRAGDEAFRVWTLNEARGVENSLYRLQGLAGVAKRTEHADALVAETRDLLVRELSSLRRIRRKILLRVFSHPALFAPPVLSPVEAVVLANDILDVCAWRWV